MSVWKEEVQKIAEELAAFIKGYDKLDAEKFLAYAE